MNVEQQRLVMLRVWERGKALYNANEMPALRAWNNRSLFHTQGVSSSEADIYLYYHSVLSLSADNPFSRLLLPLHLKKSVTTLWPDTRCLHSILYIFSAFSKILIIALRLSLSHRLISSCVNSAIYRNRSGKTSFLYFRNHWSFSCNAKPNLQMAVDTIAAFDEGEIIITIESASTKDKTTC